ncbi:MAG: hypothetical protein VKK04_05985 [Synechococcales bacterium]|nr:hypothetical protein [Synechococcales bacterium]
MVHSIDDITRQARQGSVAAIIQVLNERLAESGIRARAVLARGVLQLLCEAANAEQLERQSLVERIRQILEAVQPRHIRRVKINSRIVNEQQLLWLDEIRRDPEAHLLWTAEIVLARPNLLKQLAEDWTSRRQEAARGAIASAAKPNRHKQRRPLWQGVLGSSALGVLLLIVGWSLWDWTGRNRADSNQQLSSAGVSSVGGANPSAESNAAPVAVQETASPDSAAAQPDAFVQAVRIAEKAVADGQTATTSTEWLDLAARWQRASDLMGQVSSDDQRYPTAQDRQLMYQKNSEEALKQAELVRPAG